MSKNPNFKSNNDGNKDHNDSDEDHDDNIDNDNNEGDNDERLRRGCCVKRFTRHMVRVPFEGGGGGLERGGEGGSLFPGRSRIRGPTRPFASQSKIQGSPLRGYIL